jgi:predicted DNA-binding WGR domain protein
MRFFRRFDVERKMEVVKEGSQLVQNWDREGCSSQAQSEQAVFDARRPTGQRRMSLEPDSGARREETF